VFITCNRSDNKSNPNHIHKRHLLLNSMQQYKHSIKYSHVFTEFIRDDVNAPFSLLCVVTVTLPFIETCCSHASSPCRWSYTAESLFQNSRSRARSVRRKDDNRAAGFYNYVSSFANDGSITIVIKSTNV